MALNRFEDICRMLRFDSTAVLTISSAHNSGSINQSDPAKKPLIATRMARLWNDRMAATRLLLDGLVTNRQKCDIHNERVTVDKELLSI